jgi:hypothetical protein
MATLTELSETGLLIAYYLNIKQQRELRAKQREIEEHMEQRYAGLLDKFKRGELEIFEKGGGEDEQPIQE